MMTSKTFNYYVCFLLLSTGAGFISTNENRIWARLSWIIILVLFFKLLPKIKYETRDLLTLLPLTLAITASMIVNENGFNVNFIQRIITIWFACAVTIRYSYEFFMDAFIKIMKFIAIFSLICFVCAPIIRMLPFPTYDAGGGTLYKCLIFTNVSMLSLRNYGPFWEPGAYQLFLNWAIFYEIRNRNKFNFKDISLFILAILSTLSTGGFAILMLNFAFYLFQPQKGHKNFYISKIIAIVILLLILVLVAESALVSDSILSKIEALQDNMETKNSSNASSYTRYYSTYACIEVIKDYPMFGVGIDGLKDKILYSYDLTANTNSILGMAATFGVIAGVLYSILILFCAFKKTYNIKQRLICLIMLLAMFCTENLAASLIFWIFIYYESKLKKTVNYDTFVPSLL